MLTRCEGLIQLRACYLKSSINSVYSELVSRLMQFAFYETEIRLSLREQLLLLFFGVRFILWANNARLRPNLEWVA